MMSLEVLRRVNEEIAAEAAQRGLVPFVPDSIEDVDHWPPFPLPNIGTLEPDGWEKTETSWFVDKTGHGYDDEPALTWPRLKRELRRYIAQHPGHGFAITEEGECQIVVSVFTPLAA